MGALEERLVQELLNTSPAYKRDVMENKIRNLLGALPLLEVTGLSARRGMADGGIDGVINIIDSNNNNKNEERAAINIKVRKSNFTREQLGGFLLDMDRESINIGIIITAAHLSPDAHAEYIRKNSEDNMTLFHIRLSDLLSGEVSNLPNILINGTPIDILLTHNLKICIENKE